MIVNHNEGTRIKPQSCVGETTNRDLAMGNSYSDENSNCFQFSKTEFWPISFSPVDLKAMLMGMCW